MSDYAHGSYELTNHQNEYIAGTAEEAERDEQERIRRMAQRELEIDAEYKLAEEKGKSYSQGQQDLYNWMDETIQDWYAMKIVNDSQMLWLKELVHEVDKQVNYELRKD